MKTFPWRMELDLIGASRRRWALVFGLALVGGAALAWWARRGHDGGGGDTALLVTTVMGRRASHAEGAMVRAGERLRSEDGKVLLVGPGGLNVELWSDSVLVPLGEKADLPRALPGRPDVSRLRLEKGTIQLAAFAGFELKAGRYMVVGGPPAGRRPVMVSLSLARRELWGPDGTVDLHLPDGSRRRLREDERVRLE